VSSQISSGKSRKNKPIHLESFVDWSILAALAVALIVTIRAWNSFGFPFPRCWFTEALHFPCPTCGSGRSLLALARFDLLTAVRLNPLLVVVIAGLLVMPIVVASGKVTDRFRARSTPKRVATLGAFLVLTNWIYLIFAL
jgi:hypothetical protein